MLHNKRGETDVGDTVKRILGKAWYYIFSISSGVLMLMLGVIYFILMNNMFYPMLQFINGYTFHADIAK